MRIETNELALVLCIWSHLDIESGGTIEEPAAESTLSPLLRHYHRYPLENLHTTCTPLYTTTYCWPPPQPGTKSKIKPSSLQTPSYRRKLAVEPINLNDTDVRRPHTPKTRNRTRRTGSQPNRYRTDQKIKHILGGWILSLSGDK